MRRYGILLLAVLALVATSCGSKGDGDVIPRAKMAKVYADMFVTDQWISQQRGLNRQIDTSLVYAPVFEKYGITADDFRTSVYEYSKDPERYARMLKKTVLILEHHSKFLKAEQARLDREAGLAAEVLDLKPEKIFWLSGLFDKETFWEEELKLYVDTTGCRWDFDPWKDIDTLWQGPLLIFPEEVVEDADSEEEDASVEEEKSEPEEEFKPVQDVLPFEETLPEPLDRNLKSARPLVHHEINLD